MSNKYGKRTYDRNPTTKGWTKIADKLQSTGGWKLRSALEQLADQAQTDFGASAKHLEEKQWADYIVCLEDGIETAEDIKRELERIAYEQ